MEIRTNTDLTRADSQLLFDANPHPMWIYNLDTLSFLEVNDAAVEKYGYSREEFLSMTIKDIRPPEEVDRLLKHARGARPIWQQSGIWKHTLKSGRIIDVEITSHTITFKGQQGAFVVAMDVTERIRAERELKEREYLLSEMGRVARVGGWEVNVDTMDGTWTDEVARIHDLDPKDGINVEKGLSFYASESRIKIEAALNEAITRGKPFDLELDIVSAKGTPKRIRTIGVPVVEGGRTIKLRGAFQDITQLRTAERELSRYQVLANHARDIILFVRKSDGRIIEANASAVSAYGYSRDELLTLTIMDLRDKSHGHFAAGQMAEADIKGIVFETVHMRKDGTSFPVEVSSVGIDLDGTRVLVSVIRDITQRLGAEKSLRREREVLRLFVQNSPAAIAMFDREMRYIFASRRFLADYRLGDIDVTGKSHYEIFPEIPERWKEIHRRCLAGNTERCEEDLFTRQDGSIEWEKWEIHPWYEDSGQVGGIILFSEVITREKLQAAELEMSRLRLLGLINSAMDGIISLDENQKIILFNSASEKMFRVSAAEMLGKTLDSLLPERYRVRHRKLIDDFGRTGKSSGSYSMTGTRVVTGLRATGEEFPIESSISQIEVGGKKVYTVIHRDVTEQLVAREELRDSEEKYRSLYENSTVGIYRTTPEGAILLANPALVQMLGYESFDELASRNLEKEGYHPSYSRSVFQETIESAGEIRGLESVWTRKDGTTVHVRESAKAIRGEDGKTLFYDGVVVDVTDRKLAEEQLLIKNAAIESSISPIGLADTSGKVFYVNKAFLNLWGYESAEELRGRDITSFSLSQERILGAVEHMKTGKGYLGEGLGRKKDGTTFYFQISANIVMAADGSPVCLMASFIDITARKESQQKLEMMYSELKASEENYRSLFQQSKDAIVLSEPGGRIIDCNLAGLELFGFDSREDAMSSNMGGLYMNPAERLKLLDDLRKFKYVRDRELNMRRKNGDQIIVSSTTSVVFNEDDAPVSLVTVARDITKQKSMQQQLAQAQRMESVGTLAAGIAHDFNNILGIILGYSTFLESGVPTPEKVKRSFEAIQRATVRGTALVKQLLTFARKTESVFQGVNLNTVVDEVTKLLKETLPKTVVVSADLADELPLLVGDATQIHQVLLNLCVNARDAMPKGGELKITTTLLEGSRVMSRFPVASSKEYILLKVSDTGIGMSEEIKRRIFDPFFTTKEVGKGTGLGLALVHSIVTNHGGFTEVESQEGKSTTFQIYFPVHDEINEALPDHEESAETVEGGDETILLVEDEDLLRELVKTVLESKGYRVLTAGDGEAGLKLYCERHGEIRAVISDLGLPRLGGEEALKRMKTVDPVPRLIAASGFIEPDVKAGLSKAGVEAFVQKPYALGEVLRRLREVLDKPQ